MGDLGTCDRRMIKGMELSIDGCLPGGLSLFLLDWLEPGTYGLTVVRSCTSTPRVGGSAANALRYRFNCLGQLSTVCR
jgi:hypothetical protein